MARGQIFTTDGEKVLIEDYHFGDGVAYEYATQIRFDEAAQAAVVAALNLSEECDASTLAQALKDRFVTFRAARQFADEHGIPYKLKTDMQP
jgi:predicted secreted protein